METESRRASRNRTLSLSDAERAVLRDQLLSGEQWVPRFETNRVVCADALAVMGMMPPQSVDLLFADPPYNLNKTFGQRRFRQMHQEDYRHWLRSWLALAVPLLKPEASLYVCGDWRSAGVIYEVLSAELVVQNRITWEREKGRGARNNWKSAAEDIWFATKGRKYYFNSAAVRMTRRVRAPYRDGAGLAKDWRRDGQGQPVRLTHASNLWTDLSVPFWSMPENTEHPTQKPEKLLAKIILASSQPGQLVFDPFLGSGTSAVVAKKLGRRFWGIEIEEEYSLWALKRLAQADSKATIQGYEDGVFWERNSQP